jgi:hypothetical protein
MVAAFYRSLLKLYPREHRSTFADEMLDVFRDARADAGQRTVGGRMAFYLREIAGLLGGAARERLRDLRVSHECKLKIGGSMNQQSRCRFPRFSVVMMTVIFLIVLEIIAKGEGLSHYLFGLPAANGQPLAAGQERWNLGNSIQHWPSHYGLLSGVALGFLIAWAAGLAAWAIAYLLRRTGVQHFGETQSWPASR